ncbi:MAG TPA: SDR family NAD(P)-dependent oxidoreductase [Streptosporangiaceae bacterium]|jgi:2-hydroxycyclohexanecarboxyl-CoA dehydrogenase
MGDVRTAVVTGAASGIGAAVAARLAADGLRVVAADIDVEGAGRVAEALPGDLRARRVDVTDGDSIAALRADVHASVGVPRVLVNCAGWDEFGMFADTDRAFWEKVVAINYLGVVAMTHAFLPDLTGGGDGTEPRVVNIASDAGRGGSMGETVYAGAKGGVIAFTKSLAREAARDGVTANAVCPGPTDTPLFEGFPDKIRGALVKAIPLRRLADPADIAHAVSFFVSPGASYVTGQVLSVSGGLTMNG